MNNYNNTVNFSSVEGSAISPLEELRIAVEKLYACPINSDFTYVNDRVGIFYGTMNYLRQIAKHFKDVNPQLSAAWENSADFTNKISSKLDDTLETLIAQVNKFIENSMNYEKEINAAVTNANAKAEELLQRLGL